MNKIFLKILVIILMVSGLQINQIKANDVKEDATVNQIKDDGKDDDKNKIGIITAVTVGTILAFAPLIIKAIQYRINSKTRSEFVNDVFSEKGVLAAQLNALDLSEPAKQKIVENIGDLVYKNISASDIRLIKNKRPGYEGRLISIIENMNKPFGESAPLEIRAAIFDGITKGFGLKSEQVGAIRLQIALKAGGGKLGEEQVKFLAPEMEKPGTTKTTKTTEEWEALSQRSQEAFAKGDPKTKMLIEQAKLQGFGQAFEQSVGAPKKSDILGAQIQSLQKLQDIQEFHSDIINRSIEGLKGQYHFVTGEVYVPKPVSKMPVSQVITSPIEPRPPVETRGVFK